MTNAERIESLEARLSELEANVLARVDAVLGITVVVQGLSVDVLALIALHDRDLVENFLRVRRLSHQASGSGEVSAEMLKRYEMSLDLADHLSRAEPLRPR